MIFSSFFHSVPILKATLGSSISKSNFSKLPQQLNVIPHNVTLIPKTKIITNSQTISVAPLTKHNDNLNLNPPHPSLSVPSDFISAVFFNRAYAIPSNQSSVTYTEWAAPTKFSGHNVASNVFVSPNSLFFVETNTNEIARLDMSTNTITEWPLIIVGANSGANSGPYGITSDPSGNIWFLELGGKVAMLNTTTNRITEYTGPFGPYLASYKGYAGNTLTFDAQGKNLWWANSQVINRFRISNNTLTQWDVSQCAIIPGCLSGAFGLAIDSSNNVFVTASGSSSDLVGRLSPSTNSFTFWYVPTGSSTIGASIDSSNNLWFGESSANRIAKLDPSSNQVTSWAIPTTCNSSTCVTDVKVNPSGSNVLFTQYTGARIGRLDPSTNLITLWPMPTGAGNPGFISLDPFGNMYITEDVFNKVAKIS